MQLAITDLTPIRARRTDPATSHRAAADSVRFAGSHAGRILACLKTHGRRDTHQLSLITGLTIVQIDRRKKEMEEAGLIRTADDSGRYSVLEAV
jgi:hypothetical protein